jgi:hypothetical protein
MVQSIIVDALLYNGVCLGDFLSRVLEMDDYLNTSIFNHTYCLHVDESLDFLIDMRNVTMTNILEANLISSAIIIMFSIISIVFGARLFKIVAACLASFVGFFAVYKMSANNDGLSCDMRLLMSGIAAVVFGIGVGCVINLALFVLGALSFVFLVHLVFSAFPGLHTLFDTSYVMQKSLLYWVCVLVAGLIGGIMFRCNRKRALEVTTSVVGGIGLAYGVHGIMGGANVDGSVFVAIASLSAITGILTQQKLRGRKLCQKKNRRRSSDRETEIVARP